MDIGDNQFLIKARGHPNILSSHRTTWQITKEKHLTTKADCIIAVSSDASCVDLPDWLKNHLQNSGKISIELNVLGLSLLGMAEGHPELTFENEVDMVFRKSTFISERTVSINSSFVARDLPGIMIKLLQDPKNELQIIISKL